MAKIDDFIFVIRWKISLASYSALSDPTQTGREFAEWRLDGVRTGEYGADSGVRCGAV
jgi:hypothetical protein